MERVKSKEKNSNKGSPLCSLDLFLDESGIIRVGRRIRKSGLNQESVYPIFLSEKSKIADLIGKWCSSRTAHSRTVMTLKEIRCNNFWML